MNEGAHRTLRYGGRTIHEPKQFVWGTHRAMDPAETLERIRPHLRHAGITRVADITGLDTIGIPVAVAIRPASATLAVEGGKGVTFAAAMASAAMEAIERFVAEVDPVDDVWGAVAEVADRVPVGADEFPMFRYAALSSRRAYAWTCMRDLRTDDEQLVPRDLVRLGVDEPEGPFMFPWAASSNGLASGNNLAEAICAGLYEVIERDATTCWQFALGEGAPRFVVDPATIDGPVITEILDTLDRAGVRTQITWCPTDVGVPTCMAFVLDSDPGIGVYKGYGCHLEPEVAMVRAVTEAVQSRTIFVAGARDDLIRPGYEAMKRSDVFTLDEFQTEMIHVSLADIPNRATPTFDGDITVMLDLLDRAGFDNVLARQLDADRFEAAVARVVIPGLETYRFPWVRLGDRARTFDPAAFSCPA